MLRVLDDWFWRSNFSPSGKQFLLIPIPADGEGSAQLLETDSGRRLQTFDVPDAVFAPDGKKVLSSGNDGLTRVWDAATGRILPQVLQGTSPEFSPDGREVLTVRNGRSPTVEIWDAASARKLQALPLPTAAWVWSAVFSRDGKTVLFDLAGGRPPWSWACDVCGLPFKQLLTRAQQLVANA